MMYKVVVQTVILYGSMSWVLTEAILEVLEGFHHKVDWMGVIICGEGLGGGGTVANERVYWGA